MNSSDRLNWYAIKFILVLVAIFVATLVIIKGVQMLVIFFSWLALLVV